MKQDNIIYFMPDDAGKKLTTLIEEHGIQLDTRCAGQGTCGGCEVELLEGSVINIQTAAVVEGKQKIFACIHSLSPFSAATIRIPQKSIISNKSSAVDKFKIHYTVINDEQPEVISQTDKKFSLAIDVGTTTVAVMLVDRESAAIIDTETAFNAQIKFGDNVLTRIKHCQTDPAMTQTLQHTIMVETLLPLINKLLIKANIDLTAINEVVISGNTTMQHLCAGVNPETIGVSPFTPVFTTTQILSFSDIFEIIDIDIPVILLPSISAYLGADILAGAFVTEVSTLQTPALIVDVGTNGEMILNTGSTLTGCSTAAGPAFEGAGLSSGTRAAAGAISHIKINDSIINLEVIGNTPETVGICGTAYFDFLAECIREKLLSTTGRFTDKFIKEYPDYVRKGEGGMEICLEGIGRPDSPKITEADISSLLQAKAAVAAGVETMLNRFNLKAKDLKNVYLAGGFGLHLNIESALACGLLPEVELSQLELVGNTSLAGAYVALKYPHIIDKLADIAQKIEVVKLNLDEDFEDFFIDNMMLPC